jgi:hypothetical protein
MDNIKELELKTQICCSIIQTSSALGFSKADAGKLTNKIWADLVNPPSEEK